MTRTMTFACLTGFIAGAALTVPLAALSGESVSGHLVPTVIRTAGVLTVLLVAGRVFRVWLKESHTKTCDALQAAADERTASHRALDARTADLAKREARLAASLSVTEARQAEMHKALLQEVATRVQLEAEYSQLTEDYNALVCGTLQQSASLFRPRQTRAPLSGTAPLIPMPLPVRVKGGQQIENAKRKVKDVPRHDRATSPIP
ncbi:hypothetical protein [Streptomyces californicus]|uniref:hypothetical protein n=1 Tax=Streptomyces californicus TaxID=67351 RepID=UPI003815B397